MTEILKQFLKPFSFILVPLMIGAALAFLFFAFYFVKKLKEYKSSAYYEVTKLPYLSVLFDLGRHGEYLTYTKLKQLEASGSKFLFNIYIPKSGGETTEIDVLMICAKGIFVFESKNYSGWIFGSENQKNWYQTLPAGKGKSHKEAFYNPIMQNRSHIKHLNAFLGGEFPMHSVIVFSERCTLKNVQVTSRDIRVINRNDISSTVAEICSHAPLVLSESDISEVYEKLYPLTQVDEAAKEQHIENIRSKQTAPERAAAAAPAPQPEPSPDDASSAPITPQAAASDLNEQAPAKTESAEKPMLKCPKCGGELILRVASRGANAGNKFYGCSNYPKCKYIKNAAGDGAQKTDLE